MLKDVIESASHESFGRSGYADWSHRSDRRFLDLPANAQERIQRQIDELGSDLRGFTRHRMQGVNAFRLRVGDYRVIYEFNVERNELYLITVGHRRETYKAGFN